MNETPPAVEDIADIVPPEPVDNPLVTALWAVALGVVAAKHQGDFGRSVRLDVPNAAGGTLHVAITDKPPFTVTPRFWRELGLEARAADAIVQKALFHYRIFYVASSFRHLAVHTDGASSLERVYQRPYAVPTYPIDQPSDWRPYDPLLRDPTQLSAPRRATA